MINKIMPIYFRLGEFVSIIQQQGFYHKDMKLDNIGCTENLDIVFLDYADMDQFLYPYELNIDKMSRCLMPLLRKRSFEEIAMFRLGYICSGGEVSEKVFRNLYKGKFSSLDFWSNDTEVDYDGSDVAIDYANAIEWQKNCNAETLFSNFCSLEEYQKSQIRESLSNKSKYFLDKYFLCVYFNFFNEKKAYNNLAIILFNLGLKEYLMSHMVAAYIYFELSKELIKRYKISNKCLQSIIEEKLDECRRKTVYKVSFLAKVKNQIIREQYDLAQTDWIIYDLENIIWKETTKVYKIYK